MGPGGFWDEGFHRRAVRGLADRRKWFGPALVAVPIPGDGVGTNDRAPPIAAHAD